MERRLLVFLFTFSTFFSLARVQSPEIKIPCDTGKVVTEIYKTVGTTVLRMKLFYPGDYKLTKPLPAIAFFFGGGWVGGSIDQFKLHAGYLASRGMIAILVDYRVKGRNNTTPFEAAADAKSAIRYLRANAGRLGIDPDRLAAGGGSAGGHLAAVAGNIAGLDQPGEDLKVNSKPDALLLFNPVFDNGPNGYGFDACGGEARYREISPIDHIRKGAPPTIVFLGTSDKLIPVSTAQRYKNLMEDVGSRCDLFLYQGQEHGFFNKGRQADKYFLQTLWQSDLFLASLGYLKGKPTFRIQSETYCNPLNINYSMTVRGRHAADPVIVLFKDKYYLFTTWDIKGYRVSDDLFHWQDVLFSKQTWAKVNCTGTITAPAVASDGNFLYFINYNAGSRNEPVKIFKTKNPETGVWEVCGSIRTVADPALFIEKGRFYVYYGLGASVPTQCFELDPATFTEIPGSNKILKPALKGTADYTGGYNRGRRELFDETDAAGWFGKFSNEPCPEAAWMTKYNDRYYLQYATPGTVSQWYSDIVMEGESPTGPFKESAYNPVSMKVGGFIGSAGHSCVFQDKNSLWWRITTMWVGKHDLFERRLGLFPVTFDAKGRMSTHTDLGDYPMFRNQSNKSVLFKPEWYLLSYGKKAVASSALDSFKVEHACDENVRTWWSAKTGNSGEWLSVDLGKVMQVNAVQVNFAEQAVQRNWSDSADYNAYQLFYSNDGKSWDILVNKSENKKCVPHDYIELEGPRHFRYLRIENVHSALGGKFAISDLRVFGNGEGEIPDRVMINGLIRDKSDSRNASIFWNRSKYADGYLVRFGIDRDFLNQCIQVTGAEKNRLGIHILQKDAPYFYRIDSYNSSGMTQGFLYEEK